ncbi:glycosyltransferase family 2 protein [Thermodesulforhabdus norvegica]|uniref:Rhamnosyltransferase n=1 Tax=Thermodesulforhabdus norvegica TaxID=39841 RepID=A0A1I4SK78_9BACT|nr:glycosyltransferase family 2 protein [Thermodesulforhabdus norvegica]SFM64673.1 rhamnosyltransferase [Thermodesulforhabdus norvegica]
MEADSLGSRTAAVIVSFHPTEDLSYRIMTILKQVGLVIVVDNTPGGASCLQGLEDGRLKLIVNGENRGLAAAQNQGIRFAIECGFEWVLLLDQDSLPAPDFMEVMSGYYWSLTESEKEKLLMLAPNVFDELGGFFYRHVLPAPWGFIRKLCGHQRCLKGVFFSISSGSLIPVRVFSEIGLMDEDFFIDYVDNDFCLRGLSKGMVIHVVCPAVLFHSLGDRRRYYSLGPVKVRPSFHPPLRRYFIYRNRVRVWKRYGRKVPGFVMFDLLAAIYDVLRIIFFEENSGEKLLAAFRGLSEGIRLP